MINQYKQALSLYNQGNYEEALDLLYGETDKESLLLKAACKKSIRDQYVYLIKSALDQKEYARARHLKDTYVSKFGQDTTINAFQIPDEALSTVLKEEIQSNDMLEFEYSLDKKPKKSSMSLFFFVGFGIILLFLFVYLIIFKCI